AFRRRDIARTRLQELITEAVRDRRARGVTGNDMLQIYMDAQYEDGTKLSEHIITGMVIWFMFAGHHTSSNTSAWTLLEICRHPQYQAALKAEIDKVFETNRVLAMNVQKDLSLLEGFMRESLRFHPPLNALTRRVMYDWEYKGYKVE